MVLQNKRRVVPRWMDAFLEIKVYESKQLCRKHNKYETVFCCKCMGEPVCELCWRSSTEHEGHQSLQVYAASRRTGIEVTEIAKAWDASEIQKYKINNKFVYYLNPPATGAEDNNHSDKCETCKRKLMESKYRFCSIACKKTSIELSLPVQGPLVLQKTSIALSVPVQGPLILRDALPCTYRKRRRKGSPKRSPLY